MKVYHQRAERRLVHVDHAATPEFWDEQWAGDQDAEAASAGANALEFVGWTRRYLATGTVLEGGCGNGGVALALHRAGYRVVGVDFAEKAVSRLNDNHPEVDIRIGDVRDLPVDTASCDGYWSLGVIEHFWAGYENIIGEAARVLRPGGYLFLTFPAMSALRRVKAAFGAYPELETGTHEPEGFYQFILDPGPVEVVLRRHGFSIAARAWRSPLKGLADEVRPLASVIRKSRGLPARVFRKLASFGSTLYGHGCLVVARRNAD